jgi:hypothetical protein
VLALAFVGLVGWSLLRVRRTPAWPTAAALTVGFAYWAVHGAVDWLWEFPALSGAAFMFLGVAVGLEPRMRRPAAVGPPGRLRRWSPFAIAGVGIAAAAIVLVPAWLSARELDQARRISTTEPAAALRLLSGASRLNPFDDEAAVLAGVVAGRAGDEARLERELRRALDRNPSNWYAALELGVALMNEGRGTEAGALLERAHALNPSEPTIELARRRLREGRKLPLSTLDAIFRQRVNRRIGSGVAPT